MKIRPAIERDCLAIAELAQMAGDMGGQRAIAAAEQQRKPQAFASIPMHGHNNIDMAEEVGQHR